jgi:hypothetical protein
VGEDEVALTRERQFRFTVAATVVLLGVALTSCRIISRIHQNNLRLNETVLQSRLDSFRLGLRLYAADKKNLPQSLAEFRASRLGHTFEDPITNKDDWQVVIGEDPKLVKGKRGIINIHSASTEISSRGTPYNTW